MKSPTSSFRSEIAHSSAVAELYPALPNSRISENSAGLSSHVRHLNRANRGISRWILLAFFGGAVVALAIVRLAIL
jgi:hypothetical protein